MTELIVALDFFDDDHLIDFAKRISHKVKIAKIGLEAFIGFGPDIVEKVQHEAGMDVFLDLKLHDIPRTMEAAVRQADKLDCYMLTVHAEAGEEALKASVSAAYNTKIVAVTKLTSVNPSWRDVVELGERAYDNDLYGIVCPGDFLHFFDDTPIMKITPEIRLSDNKNDHTNICTPKKAKEEGANYIVVGRPITQAENPSLVIDTILEQLQ